MAAEKPLLTDIFNVMSANETIEKAKEQKNPIKLWKEFWIEDEVCCLFADANVGKSILAVQIGNSIASKLSNEETVLYYDFELSKKQFELRYTDEKSKDAFKFNDNFIRVELNTDVIKDYCEAYNEAFDDVLMNGIEANINKYNSKVIIIDNITWLANMKNTGTSAAKLMMKLCTLKKKYSISILVLAHTPKRNLAKPITQNCLGGSKTFTNFFDAMFAVGKSIVEPSYRYIKQIKVRSGAFKYDTNHVQVCKIEKENLFLGFKTIGYASEESLLKVQKASSSSTTKRAVRSNKRTKKIIRRDALTTTQLDNISQMAKNAFNKFKYVPTKKRC